MKLLLALLLSAFSIKDSLGQGAIQRVKITNLENIKGDLYVGWYDESSSFGVNEKAIFRAKVKVRNQSEVDIEFKNIPPGTYAIAVFLDENKDYKLDRNFFGVPTEKYGFSNNVLPALRAATFEESAFKLGNRKTTISINLK